MQEGKTIFREALTTPEKRREVKDKGEWGKYTQLNAEFQRIARRDKKAFLNEQYKKVEENNRMGNRAIKETLHVRMGKIKHRNSKKLVELTRGDKNTKESITHDRNGEGRRGSSRKGSRQQDFSF